MRHGAIDGKCRANTNTDHHKSNLVDQAVGQNTAQIIFDHRKENREAGHGCADVNQHLSTRVSAGQGVHRDFGGKRTEENRASRRGFRVGVGQPGVQEGERALDTKGQENQPAAKAAGANRTKCQGAGVSRMK